MLAGLLASAMLGTFYLGLPLGVLRGKMKRFRAARVGSSLERILAIAVTASILLLTFGELMGSSLILMISSSRVVLAMILLSSTVTSNRLARLLAAGRTQ